MRIRDIGVQKVEQSPTMGEPRLSMWSAQCEAHAPRDMRFLVVQGKERAGVLKRIVTGLIRDERQQTSQRAIQVESGKVWVVW